MASVGSVEALANSLVTDRLIKIYVGAREVPYLISQVVLCGASEYFQKAIKNEGRMGKDNIGVLRFPEDDEHQWKVLLFWIVQKELPVISTLPSYDEEDYSRVQGLLMGLWILGDKYLMPKLQNAAMMILLEHLDSQQMVPSSGQQALLSHTTTSILGRLVCESIVEVTHGGSGDDRRIEWLHNLDGIPGAIVAILAALESFDKSARLASNGWRYWPSRTQGSETWEEFMVRDAVEEGRPAKSGTSGQQVE